MDEKQEHHQRKRAIRLWQKGVRPSRILEIVSRGRTWLSKWKARYRQHGWKGLHSQSRKPQRSSHAYPPNVRRLIVCAYRRVQKRRWGLRGMSATRRELRVTYRLRPAPSVPTIKRVLRGAGVFKHRRPAKPESFYPKPRPTATYTIQAMDWTERFLGGGAKIYAFHTIDLETRACAQTIQADKTTASVMAHLKKVWKTRGIPQGLQMDNDAAFYGGRKAPRRLGQVVRLCLYVGIEPIFIPVGEAKRNGDVERLHGIWDQAVWQQVHFDSVKAAQDFTPQFEQWYMNEYEPPKLNGQTPQQAADNAPRYRLTASRCQTIPEILPIVAGRIHFIRRVDDDGKIEVLNEQQPISKRLAGEYVWATLWTHRRRLDVFYRRSDNEPVKRIKTIHYPMGEHVTPLKPQFKRYARRRNLFTMS